MRVNEICHKHENGYNNSNKDSHNNTKDVNQRVRHFSITHIKTKLSNQKW
jgi:hypothetical protein